MAVGCITGTDANATETVGEHSKSGRLIPDVVHRNKEYGYLAIYQAVPVSTGHASRRRAAKVTILPRSGHAARAAGARFLARRRIGLLPSALFFIGTGTTFHSAQAGTLFLSINDDNAVTNGGGYNVSITFTPAP